MLLASCRLAHQIQISRKISWLVRASWMTVVGLSCEFFYRIDSALIADKRLDCIRKFPALACLEK